MGNRLQSGVPVELDDEAIRAKAHQLWVERGCPEGNDQQDWYEAERLLREAAGQAAARSESIEDQAAESADAASSDSERPASTRTGSSTPAPKRSSKSSNANAKSRTRKR